jgi:nucleoside-diphosphate-sugar epimerase
MERALVTGGCGFIGSNLTKKLLEEGWCVDVVDDMSNGHLEFLEGINMRVVPVDLLPIFDENFERPFDTAVIIQGDFAHLNVLEKVLTRQYDVVFHQAAMPSVSYSVEQPAITADHNVNKYVRLLDACRGNVKRVVAASSSSIYGCADTIPTTELEKRDPQSPYALQKCVLEDFSKMFCKIYDIDIVCLRYFNVFGENQVAGSPYATAIASWCHAIKSNIPLRSDGDGTQSRDLCHVDNVVSANILAAKRKKAFMGKSYNVCCGERFTNNEILAFFKEKFPSIEIENAPWRQGDVMHTLGDWTEGKNEYNYSPHVKFWDGLERTIDWWRLKNDNI